MQSITLDTKEASTFAQKWFAARDARMRSYTNSSHFTSEQKTKAERMKMVLEMLYAAREVHINFRKTFVSVKVDSLAVRDRKSLLQIESDWENEGITKVVSKQGVVYRIMKQNG